MARPIFSIIGLFFWLIIPFTGWAQFTLEGKVTGEDSGKPLSGATILVPETQHAAIADQDGYFRLTLPDSTLQVNISFVGYQTQRINPGTCQNFCHVELVPREQSIPEVVIRAQTESEVQKLFHASRVPMDRLANDNPTSNASIYSSLDKVPGVHVEAQDLSGLAEKNVRIRGLKSIFGGMTVEGIPNYGVMPIGPRDYLYDTENIRSVSVFKGSVPADVLSATGNKGGVIRLMLKRPQEEPGITFRQSLGSDLYTRSFVRLDAGRLPFGTAVFGSYSFTRSDKWKGAGQVGPRHNINLGLSHQFNKSLRFEGFFVHQRLQRHDFRELTYDQARDVSNHRQVHFLEQPSPEASDKAWYYDNNKGTYLNSAFYGILQYNYQDHLTFSLKPYLAMEDADSWHKQITGPPGNPNYMLFNRMRDVMKTGIIAESSINLQKMSLSAGYWLERNDLGAKVRVYRLQTGAPRVDLGYNPLTENASPGFIHNPYFKVSGILGPFDWHAGMKYFFYQAADRENYAVNGDNRTPLPALNVQNEKYAAWLPTLGVSYSLAKEWTLSLSYGKNYMRPYMYGPLRSLYLREKETFLAKGVRLQDILDDWKMETSDQLNFKAGWSRKNFSVALNPFYSWHHDVLTPVVDPVTGVQYPQNVGEVRSFGVEFQGDLDLPGPFAVFVNGNWMQMHYNQNITVNQSGESTTIDIKGNQSPAVPGFSLYSELQYKSGQLTSSLSLRYTGQRYGDALNQEKISSYQLINFRAAYDWNVQWAKGLKLTAEIKNVFNRHYVGRIDAMDYEYAGQPSYYAGMPRAYALSLTALF